MTNKLLAENKLILLFLLYQMDTPMSVSQLVEFAVDKEYMDYFSFQQYLHEIEDENLVETRSENDSLVYAITAEGEQVLSYFSDQIPSSKRTAVLDYTKKNKGRIKTEFSVVANYFYNREKDYVVKCGVYEDNKTLMEINVSVPTKEDAKLLKRNWKNNVPHLYGSILHSLLMQPESIEQKSLEIAEAISKNKSKGKTQQ